ncbi:PQQ-binding-like beta-propeller repeat protein [Anatilimnocola floriformis]|uniref:PQQ-binding-like beta-propeller repeat protein n=1 Tax=Anatilimnocola floriformis TaxID=2948575 RepID=UPI0020C26B06|nr:PQQ-binding-like beta-propeller repeat protein [Anatilimnocola floriformis]
MSDIANPGVKPIAVKEPFQLRLWPAVVITVLMLAALYIPPLLQFDNPLIAFMAQFYAPMAATLALGIWWLFFSRVSWLEGFGVLGFAIAVYVGTFFVADSSMAMPLLLSALPRLILVGVSWLIMSMILPWPTRRIGLLIAILCTCAYFTLFRFEGVTGEFASKMSFRWEKTAEQKYLASRPVPAKTDDAPKVTSEAEKPALTATDDDWIAFRGKDGNSVYSGPPISEKWSPDPPKQIWKRPVGPGWGSFIIVGNLFFTQEQRGEQEIVTAYAVETGEPVWEFAENARFEEAIAGAGPRSTPLFHDGKLFTVGAKGSLNCLDAATGKKIWNASIVGGGKEVELPQWGYSCSPIIVGDAVITMPGKPNSAAVTAFDVNTGKPLWTAADGEHSYTSAQVATICGVRQVLAFTSAGLMGITPDNGNVLWTHKWPASGYARCVQPYVEGDTVVISTYFGMGARKVQLTKTGDAWEDKLVWESKGIKPYYNDMVVSGGHAYGFDNNIFCCIDLATGERNWKGGRYGCGQVLLLEKQQKLLVLSEQGDVVLLEVNPDKNVELAKFPAIHGKTWNHPVVAHGKLFVRNGEEMACFDVKAAE